MSIQNPEILAQATQIVAAFVSKNTVAATEIPGLIQSTYAALSGVGQPVEVVAEKPQPAVSIKKSVTPDFIVCLEDGKKLKMLKRHLRTAYNMTPEDYRAKWGLPADYPMVAPNYASLRSDFAKKIGLGKKAAPVKAKGKAKGAKDKTPAVA